VLDGDEGRHAATVRRIAPGEQVLLADGAGVRLTCDVLTAGKGELGLRVVEVTTVPEPDPRFVLVQALAKGERDDQAVEAATEYGVDVVKIFPASLGGPGYLKSLRGPFPDVPFMPTGGVTPDNIDAWFAAGAIAVGAGSDLVSAADLASDRYDEVERKARLFMPAGVGA